MGYWGTGLFANDHACDVRDHIAHDLERQIDAGASAFEHAPKTPDDDVNEWDTYKLLEDLDTTVLAPLALLTALCGDPVTHAQAPIRGEIAHWREIVEQEYARIQRLEQGHAPRPEGSILANLMPGKEPSPTFWPERERETWAVFDRLASLSRMW